MSNIWFEQDTANIKWVKRALDLRRLNDIVKQTWHAEVQENSV